MDLNPLTYDVRSTIIFPGSWVLDFSGNSCAQNPNKAQTKRADIMGIQYFCGLWYWSGVNFVLSVFILSSFYFLLICANYPPQYPDHIDGRQRCQISTITSPPPNRRLVAETNPLAQTGDDDVRHPPVGIGRPRPPARNQPQRPQGTSALNPQPPYPWRGVRQPVQLR